MPALLVALTGLSCQGSLTLPPGGDGGATDAPSYLDIGPRPDGAARDGPASDAPAPDAALADAKASPPDKKISPDGCKPSCAGKKCGSNGCGGSCGACIEGTECKAGVCHNKVLYTDKVSYAGKGQLDPNKSYFYAPKLMFDVHSGTYKLWGCGGVAGDHIVFKEAASLDALNTVPWYSALKPLANNKFDHTHTCDPSVIRVGNAMYLYYGGFNEKESKTTATTRVGAAVSTNGGKDFTRLNNGNPIIDVKYPVVKGKYGVGQPSVAVGPGGQYYMIYTYQNEVIELRVIKSSTPTFSSYTKVRTIIPSRIGAWSVDLAYNAARKQFVVTGNNSSHVTTTASARMVHLDTNFKILGYTGFAKTGAGFRFGEGLALLTDSAGGLGRLHFGKKHAHVFAASTWKDTGCSPTTTPCHILNPTRYVTFTEGPAGVLPNFKVNGWDLGRYNPNGLGNFYIYHGEEKGWFSDQTAWKWGTYFARVFSGDFNGDGKYDVGLYSPNGKGLFYINYGTGAGAFTGQTTWKWGVFGKGTQLITGDFDGDKKWDLCLYNPNGAGTFYIQYGDGKGSFGKQTAWKWGVYGAKTQAFSGDFNGDCKWDVGLYNPNNKGAFYIHYGKGTGAFTGQTAWTWGVYGSATQAFSGDFNGDGKWDVGLYNPHNQGRFYMNMGLGNGKFAGQRVFAWGTSGAIFTGKFRP